MSEMEKRARELLDWSLGRAGERKPRLIHMDDALHAIRTALAPPEGYVLVPVELTHEMYCAFVEQWFTKVRAIDDTEMEDCYAALLAARPEVSGG